MDFFPIFMNIKGRQCLVIGGGKVAARKITLLLKAHAQVQVVAPELCREVSEMAKTGQIKHISRRFEELDICDSSACDSVLVIAATNDQHTNKTISELAKARSMPVNVVDQPHLCSFIMPSIVDRSPIQIAISTGGSSPVLARLLRTRLESYIPSAYGKLAQLVDGFRSKVIDKFPSSEQRRYFWEVVLEGRVTELLFQGNEHAAKHALQRAIDEDFAEETGEVYLVGAGPGDPDLLTFRALRLMQRADVVVYDRLVSQGILDLVRRDAELVYVGKERDNHAVPQDNINQLLVDYAKKGLRVLRLKGGDPFIFGRGGEEIETLKENDVIFQVVPGITAAAGCSSYGGIPLTHRDFAQSCVFVTGHLKDGTVNLNWTALAHQNQTIVFYMGLQAVKVIHKELVANGLSDDTPAALVEQGTTENQRVHIGTLSTLAEIVEREKVKAPTLIIVGDVVKLHDKLKWFNPTSERTNTFQSARGRRDS
ncbi:MAG: siroheme synthase CysG [gamma proteobacterium symbiont of Bathyaustriella thionipta]|nr:siroheme synthase CysG [gamma proteobacterium symbiont of Bathyaustriella thionipta]MCU7950969.1 siroheme synthase CysG [gamma proteobacterium symbiont of Bathyaustriella thionipta]MCU7953490.1 siroheme synthase CysG [gamma proteobacterium symbiont of Bathyaustriella thionipta]MCU7957460.1 siroheme synthase CysG [gamma proteobacterium symbiont of Bathyaustriella thionipta]MCU7966482.1 siroheme synthase CysG [gamma proteobacterium symbiont of Bathyaustriella thionipta]